ncbi:MAG: helix-turn-helix domain-containing protein [Betaproteobacteria bacterium]|nr:helix-turn-helix domain-containing protein [Betaproteobacteria bacterium]
MSTRIMAACWPLQMPPTVKSVLVSLADNANDHGYCFPSIAYICERTCYAKDAVIEAIKWLEGSGIVTADRGNGRHTTYILTPENFNADFQMASRREQSRCINRSGKTTGRANRLNQSGKPTRPVGQTDSTGRANRH